MSANGWDQLNCRFFAATCRRVLGRYLQQQGFVETETNMIGGIVFARFDICLEVSYEAESCPSYTPSIVLGIRDRPWNKRWRLNAVPMWYVLPIDHPQKMNSTWIFKTEGDLERVFLEIETQFLDTVARNLWSNRDALEKEVRNFRAKSLDA